MSNVVSDFLQYVGQTSDHSLEFEVEKGKGAYLFDKEGKKYLDFHSGVGVMAFGHAHALVNGFMKDQLDRYSHTMVYGEHVQDMQVEYAKNLALIFNGLTQEKTLIGKRGVESNKQVFFTNSGNESLDLAIKTSRKVKKQKGLVALKKAFHGRGYGAMQVTWNEDYKKGFFVDDNETDWVDPFGENWKEELESIDWSSKAAFVLEYVMGEAGAVAVPQEFLEEVREICTRENVFMVVDEVQTGFGRTGSLFAQQTLGVTADITCLGKAGGGGLPFGAVVAETEVFEEMEKPALSHISTFGGNPVVCAGGLAVLSLLTPRHFECMEGVVEELERGIEKLHEDFPDVIEGLSGVGLMRGLVLASPDLTEKFYWSAQKKGLIMHFKLNAGKVLRVSPPLIITKDHVKEALDILFEVCMEVGQ